MGKKEIKIFLKKYNIFKNIKNLLVFFKYLNKKELLYLIGNSGNKIKIEDRIVKERIFKALNKVRKSRESVYWAEEAYACLLSKDKENALNFFKKALAHNKKINEKQKKIWLKAFEYLNNNDIETGDKKTDNLPEQKNDIKKVFVSGTGWSGSGALYDYFSEFSGIVPIDTEFSHIGREISLNSVVENIDNGSFLEELLKYFKYTLVSNAIPRNNGEARAIITNIFLDNDVSGRYAEACELFIKNILDYRSKNTRTDEKLKKIISQFIDSILSKYVLENGNVLLLNNTIPVININIIRYISNCKLFCSFRDPRASYVSQYYEKRKQYIDPEKYIKNFLDIMNVYRKFSEIAGVDQVYKVQFEEFVLSEKYRKKIRNIAGLEKMEHVEFSKFKPWISEENVFNYKNFHDQKIIKKIEEELTEFLWQSEGIA